MEYNDFVADFQVYGRDRQPMYDYSISGREDDRETTEEYGEFQMAYNGYYSGDNWGALFLRKKLFDVWKIRLTHANYAIGHKTKSQRGICYLFLRVRVNW